MAKSRKLLLVSLPLLCAAMGVATAATVVLAQRNASIVSSLESEYLVGDQVNVPSKQIDCDGTLVDAIPNVLFPSGVRYDASKGFIASEGGKYTITYVATHNGKKYQESVSFKALRRGQDLFSLDAGNDLTTAKIETRTHKYNPSISGAVLSMTSGGGAKFNQLLDVSECDLSKPLFTIAYEGVGEDKEVDVKKLIVNFTDADDPTNVMSIRFNTNNDDHSYMQVKTGNQTYKGLQIVSRAGQGSGNAHNNATLHNDNDFGTPTYFSCKAFRTTSKIKTAEIYLDYKEKALYVSNHLNYPWTGKGFCIDLDSPLYQGDDLWRGFTNGKCYMSVMPTSVASTTANVFFQQIGNYDFATKTSFNDVTAPSITIPSIQGEIGPSAVVGLKYKVADAIVQDDFDLNIEATKRVRYVDNEKGISANVSIENGEFTPTIPGLYEIEYTARDTSGNETTKVVKVTASTNADPIKVDLDYTNQSLELLDEVKIPGIEDLIVSGGSGEKICSRTVYSPKARAIEVKNNLLTLEDSGDYKIVYDAVDYLGNHGSKVVTITSNPISKPKIVGEFKYPSALLKNFIYDIEPVTVKEYDPATNSTKDVEYAFYANDTKVTGNKFTASGSSMKLEYRASGSTGDATPLTKTYKVLDGRVGKAQDKYFYGSNFETEIEKEDIKITAYEDNRVEFLNTLNARSFKLDAKIPTAEFNATGYTLTLEDTERTNKVSIKVELTSAGATMQIPGGEPVATSTEITANGTRIYIKYDALNNQITDLKGTVIGTLNQNDEGKAFSGFKRLVYMSMTVDGVALGKTAIVRIDTLGPQPLGYRSEPDRIKDSKSPEIYLTEEFSSKQEVGSTLITPVAYTSDVLNPIKTFTLKLFKRDTKEVVFQDVDPREPQSITFNSYDVLILQYYSEDLATNSTTATRIIYVIENEPPLLDVSFKNVKDVYSVGNTISIPKYVASDNSGSVIVDVYLIDPTGRQYLLQQEKDGVKTSYLDSSLTNLIIPEENIVNSETFKFTKAGRYTLKVVARDNCSNYTASEHSFTVVK